MKLLNKILLKAQIETRFLLEQKWRIRKPVDIYSIPKYLLKKYLPSNPVIIDCGAHTGGDSVELARIFPKGVVHCFEPVPAVFSNLKYNTRKYNNIHCYNLALSDKTGTAGMYVSSGSSDASSSLLQPTGHKEDHPDVYFEDRIEVTTLTLDDWAERNNIPKVDFLWLDMQGFEHQMMKASSRILPMVKLIHTEVSMREAYAQSLIYADFKKWMEGHGFSVVEEAIPQGADMGNALFVKG
jgi:FkbM family methyltransferase